MSYIHRNTIISNWQNQTIYTSAQILYPLKSILRRVLAALPLLLLTALLRLLLLASLIGLPLHLCLLLLFGLRLSLLLALSLLQLRLFLFLGFAPEAAQKFALLFGLFLGVSSCIGHNLLSLSASVSSFFFLGSGSRPVSLST